MAKNKYRIGDKVAISDDFEGSITISGYSGDDIQESVFEVVPYDAFHKKHPRIAKIVKSRPTRDGEIFLKCKGEVFVLNPVSSLGLVEAALICSCPINRLWAGEGHYQGCPEE